MKVCLINKRYQHALDFNGAGPEVLGHALTPYPSHL